MENIFVCDNVSGFSINWDFATESLDLLLQLLTRKPGGHIKKLKRLARRDNIDLWFEDECHFMQHGSRCSMWVPPEDIDPIVLHAPTRKSVAFFGAVCVNDGRMAFQQSDTFSADTFETFIQYLLRRRRTGRKMVMVVDNARWHHARQLKPWLSQHRQELTLDFLPPYSPELNSIERVWKLTRRLCTHNQYFEELEALINTVTDQFEKWKKPNNILHQLCAII